MTPDDKEAYADFESAAELVLAGAGIFPHEETNKFEPPFEDTPQRFAKALLELTVGEREPCPELRTFDYTGAPQLITSIKNQAYTLCPHHLLSVELICSVGYVAHGTYLPTGDLRTDIKNMGSAPSGKILGLSKIPRLIHWAAARLTTQEDLAQLLSSQIMESTKSQAIFIHIEGTHSCMRARGIKTNGTVVTSLATGRQAGQWQEMFLAQLR